MKIYNLEEIQLEKLPPPTKEDLERMDRAREALFKKHGPLKVSATELLLRARNPSEHPG